MKKKILSFMLMLAVTAAPVSAVTSYAADTAPDITASTEKAETNNYWIFYKDSGSDAIDAAVSEKLHEYTYKLYETEKDQKTVERLSAEYAQQLRLDMLKEHFAERSAEVLAELGADPSGAFCSSFTPTIICALTEEQYQKAKESALISEISVYENELLDPLSENGDIINTYTRSEEGMPLCGDDVKFDVQSDANGTDYLVVYGLKDTEELKKAKEDLSSGSFRWDTPTMELYSGVVLEGLTADGKTGLPLKAVLFVEDEPVGLNKAGALNEYSESIGFNIAPYVISLGDINGDSEITAVDASQVLSLYAEIQTTEGAALTEEQLGRCDVDGNGDVNSVDASKILAYYAYDSTGGDMLLKQFAKT